MNKEKFYELWNSFERLGQNELLNYLENHDYFTCPASTQFHSSYPGGLLHHSLKVYEKLLELTEKNNLVWESEASIIIISLLHDICKTRFYVKDYRNVKDETGKWIKKEIYKINDLDPIGVHGDKSVMILYKLGFMLTEEEIYCIRYHMGAYESKECISSLSNAIRKYPNILYVQLADILATIEEEIEVI